MRGDGLLNRVRLRGVVLALAVLLTLLPVHTAGAYVAHPSVAAWEDPGWGEPGSRVRPRVRLARPTVQPPLPAMRDGTISLKNAWPIARRYTVKPGDNWWLIGQQFAVRVETLAEANNQSPDSFIQPGQELIIPMSNVAGSARIGPNGPVVEGPGLHFVSSLSTATCWLFQDGRIVRRWTCSPGRPESPTITGRYTVQSKVLEAYNKPSEFWMPYWLGIYEVRDVENGIHGLPYDAAGEKAWEGMVGKPVTFGCVMLEDAAARELFDLAYIGMPVTVFP